MDKIYRDDVIMTLKHCLPDGVVQDVAVKNVQRISSVEVWNKVGTNSLPEKGKTVIGAKLWQDKEPDYFIGNSIVRTHEGYNLVNKEDGVYTLIDYWMYIPEVDA